MKPSADALNHLLAQNSWALPQLAAQAGKVVRLSLPPLQISLLIEADGFFAAADPQRDADAEISLSAPGALRLLFERSAAPEVTRVAGDPELAKVVGNVLQGLHWDAEEDLSRIIGDIPAHQLTQSGLRLKQELARQAWSVAGMLSEYWLEEQPLIAKRRHLEQFSRDVDALRDDVERLAKRLEKLEQSR